jgi:hypothetical protein
LTEARQPTTRPESLGSLELPSEGTTRSAAVRVMDRREGLESGPCEQISLEQPHTFVRQPRVLLRSLDSFGNYVNPEIPFLSPGVPIGAVALRKLALCPSQSSARLAVRKGSNFVEHAAENPAMYRVKRVPI